MHVVMQMHRLFVDGGFERRVIVRQRGQFMRHFHFLQGLNDDGVEQKDSTLRHAGRWRPYSFTTLGDLVAHWR
jgi:hypothetical protein